MTFHIVLDKPTDLSAIAIEAEAGARPGHAMGRLRDRLDAIVHSPDPNASARPDDRVRSRLIGSEGCWTLARQLARQLARETKPGDLIFCASEHTGYPVAAVVEKRRDRDRDRVAVMVHNVDRVRARAAFRLLGLGRGRVSSSVLRDLRSTTSRPIECLQIGANGSSTKPTPPFFVPEAMQSSAR